MGAGPEEQIYRFIDREGNILALRPEFTSLVAKTVATRLASSPRPIRLYYSGEVLRFEKPKGGRQREFAQIGIEHYGGAGKTADVEILLIAVETFQRLGVQGFQINLGSVDFFGGIVDRMELPPEQIAELKDFLNLKDQSGLEALLQKLPLGDRRKKILRAVPHLTGGKAVIAEARELVRNPRSVEALDHLQEIYSIFERLDLAQHLTIDLGEIRGFDYYTGILFRAYVRDLGFEVASGGRYDGLPATFGEDLPAVGFSFSLDRLEQIVIVVTALLLGRHLVKIGGEILQPSIVCPDRRFVTADGGNVKFACFGGNILGHLRAQVIFWQGDEIDFDSGVLFFKYLFG